MKKLGKSLVALSIFFLMLVPLLSSVRAAEINTTEFLPSYSLAQGESKMVSFEVRNNDAVEHDFTLTTAGMSNHYELYFAAAEMPTTTVTIPAGGNVPINLNMTLIGDPTVNNDTILIKALRDDGQEIMMKMNVRISKDYQLNVTSLSDKAEVLNGKAVELTFSIKNNGAKEIKAIKLGTELPAKWFISQGGETSIDLKPGETGTIKITIEVPSSQIAGTSAVKVAAVSSEIQSNQVSIPVTVKTSANIAYWMVGLLLIITVITAIQFRKHGRR